MAFLAKFGGYYPGYSREIAASHNHLSWAILKGHTANRAGRVRLASADPREPPIVEFRYFEEGSDSAGDDLAAVVEGIRFVRRLTAPLRERGLIGEEEAPGLHVDSEGELRDYARDTAWGHHACGTCAIGRPEEGGVLDSSFRVHGVQGLRVADASIFPRIPGFFIAASVYLAAEKAADIILKEARASSVNGRVRAMELRWLHDMLQVLLHAERRFEPFFRPALNRLLREPSARVIQYLINRQRKDEGLGLAEERSYDWEEPALQSIIDTMKAHTAQDFPPGRYERAGNTKTYGILRGELIIRSDLPEHMRRGIFAEPRSFPAYVRFSNPGPHTEPDIENVGFVSIGVKLMDVPGPKLMEDEKHTQDLTAVCTRTFVTPNTRENAKLQIWSKRHLPVWYFLNPKDTHLLDFLMQSWWNETQYNPLGATYYSCVPYLLGEGQAVKYWFRPRTKVPMKIPRVPLRPPDNYLRDNMVNTLKVMDVEFDLMIQVQTDPFRMPIENAAVDWPERLSPSIPTATLRIPRQVFDTPKQLAFAHNLAINPWHSIPEHRPLGNQSRARRRMYYEMSRFRQGENGTPHIEPTGDERFD